MLKVELNQNEFVNLMLEHEYNTFSPEAAEKIYEIEDETYGESDSLYSFDHCALRGTYSEYESKKAAMKDLGYIYEVDEDGDPTENDEQWKFDRSHTLIELKNGNVLIF